MTVETTVARVAQAGKYLAFRLGRQEYGLEILKVQEITGMMGVTRVPQSPDFVRGVINLRGRVIPVVVLRRKFGMPAVADTEKTCVIVGQVKHRDEETPIGLVVDEVTEVLNITEAGIESPGHIGGGRPEAECIIGAGKMEDKVVVLLDMDEVLGSEELAGAARMARMARMARGTTHHGDGS